MNIRRPLLAVGIIAGSMLVIVLVVGIISSYILIGSELSPYIKSSLS